VPSPDWGNPIRNVSEGEPNSGTSGLPFAGANSVATTDAEGPGAVRREAPPASGLPCLNSNNSDNASASPWNLLTGAHRKVAFCLKGEIMALVEQFGIERLGLAFHRRARRYSGTSRLGLSILSKPDDPQSPGYDGTGGTGTRNGETRIETANFRKLGAWQV
jgi:hypothetical protein